MSSLDLLSRIRILARHNVHVLLQLLSAHKHGLRNIHDEIDEPRRVRLGDIAPFMHRCPLHNDVPAAKEP